MDGNEMANYRPRHSEFGSRVVRPNSLSANGYHFPRISCSVCGAPGCSGCPQLTRNERVHRAIQGLIVGLSTSSIVTLVVAVLIQR